MEDKNFESRSEEEIHVEEETTAGSNGKSQQTWTEEFTVAGEELVSTVKQLVHEANVRRIVVQNREKRILFEIPLVLGLTGIALLPIYSALALSAALVADCTIKVERIKTEEDVEAEATA
jgi:hypothetical protein